jgi:nucleotide-binding universal stress UspA family protein
MAALALERVSVWLDAFAPERGAFAHALDWAEHLGLPLRAIAAHCQHHDFSRAGGDAVVECDGIEGDAAPIVRACAKTCDRSGVPLDALTWRGPVTTGVQTLLEPAELCVFGKTLPTRLKGALLRESLQMPWASALVCPTAWQPVSRILVLYQHADPAPAYLDAVATVCHRFDSRPIVLAVARSEAEARWRLRSAAGALAIRGLAADFDTVVGGDVRSAVASVAKWRRCSHVVVAKRHATGWWRWLRGDPIEQLLDLSDQLTFLALPDTFDPAGERIAQPDCSDVVR